MFDGIFILGEQPKKIDSEVESEYIDMLGKKCTYCSTLGPEPGTYKIALIEMYVNLYVICNNCAHKNDRFKVNYL